MALRKDFKTSNFPTINITNLVDVALTMVVILLLISPFIEQGIDIKLPASSPRSINVEKSIFVTVAPGDVYYFGARKVTLQELYRSLKQKGQENPRISVVVKADERVMYKDLVVILDIIKKCKISSVGLATRVE